MANIYDQFDEEAEQPPVVAPEAAPVATGAEGETSSPNVTVQQAEHDGSEADVTVNVGPEIMQNPQARAVIEGLQQQWGGGAPIFAPGDEREQVWNTYQDQLRANSQPREDEGKRLIPGQVQNAMAAGVLDIAQGTVDFAGDVLQPILPAQARGFHTLANMFPKVKVDGAAGEVTRTITKYVGAAVGAGKIKMLQQGLGAVGTGALADFVVTNEDDTTLTNMTATGLIESYPSLEGPILDYLASDGKSEAEKKFLAALEGAALVKTAQLVFKAVKGIRGGKVDPDELALAVKEADEEVDAAAAAAGRSTDEVAEVAPKAADDAAPAADEVAEAAPKAADEAAEAAPAAPRQSVHLDPTSQQEFLANLRNAYKGGDFGADLPAMPEGTLNWSKMDSAETTQGAWSTLTDTIHGALDDVTGGVQSFEQTSTLAAKLADDIGAKGVDEVMKPLAQFADDAKKMTARLIAAKQMSQSLAREVYELSVKVDNGMASSADEAELLRRVDLLTEFTRMVKGAQTSAARMTSAGRIRTADVLDPKAIEEAITDVGGREAVGVLARRIRSTGGVTRDISKMANSTLVRKVIDVHNEFFISGILSGVKTHVVNMSSNLVNVALRPAQKIVGGAMTGQKEMMIEGFSQYNGMRLALFDSFELAGKAWRMETNILDNAHRVQDGAQRHAITAGDGSLSGANWQKVMEGDINASFDLAINAFGKFVRMPSRFLMAEDEFFKQLQYRGHVHAQAHRRALHQGLDPKSTKYADEVTNYFSRQFDEAGAGTNNPALRSAQEATFTNELKANTWTGGPTLSESIHKMVIKHPLLRGTVAPFIRTPANLMRQVWDMSGPLAMTRKQFWDDIAAGGEKRAMAVGKASTGGVMFAGAAMLAAEGHITGGGPSDPQARKEWMAAGNRPYSMTVGGETFSYHRMDPFASILGMAADYWEISGKISDEERDKLAANMSIGLGEMLWRRAGAGGTAFVSNIAGKSYLQGLTEVLGLIARGQMNKEKMVELSLNRRVAAYIPSYMQMYTNDDEIKEVRSIMDAVMARIPGYSKDVEARRDYLGEKMFKDGSGAWTAINPFAAAEKTNDPVRNEVARLGELRQQGLFTDLPEKQGNVDLTEWENDKGQSAYDRLLELMGTTTNGRGETLKQRLEREINSHNYNRRPDPNAAFSENKKVEKLQDIRRSFIDRAQRRLLKESGFRDLAKSLEIDERNAKRQSRKGLDAILNK